MAVDALGGHREVTVTMAERSTQAPQVPGCAVLTADVLRGDERLAFVNRHGYWGETTIADWRKMLSLVALEDAMPGMHTTPTVDGGADADDVVFDPRRGLYTVPPGLAESVAKSLEARTDAPGQSLRGHLLLGLAHLDAYLGEVDLARTRLQDARAAFTTAHDVITRQLAQSDLDLRAVRRRARGDDGEDGGYVWWYDEARSNQIRSTMVLAALDAYDVALDAREGKKQHEVTGHDGLRMAVDATASQDWSAFLWLSHRDTRDINQRLWALALDNDGAGLTRKLEDRGLDGRGVVDFLGARPAMSGELSRWVRHGYPTACTTCGLYPLANQIASRRDAAIAAGAADVVAETSAAAKRLRTLLLRRDVAIPLAAISELSPP
jgi:hypothetical protein